MSLTIQVFTPLEIQRIDAEEKALDQIHALLAQTKHKRGLTARDIADKTGLAVGYVNRLLKDSKLVLKRRPRHHNTWFSDFTDIDHHWRPERHRGRPRTKPKAEKPASETPLTDALIRDTKTFAFLPEDLEGAQALLKHARKLERKLNALKRGEFICIKCGLRKDGEPSTKAEF